MTEKKWHYTFLRISILLEITESTKESLHQLTNAQSWRLWQPLVTVTLPVTNVQFAKSMLGKVP